MSTINNRLQIELEDGSIVVFHPESNTGQIYDFANGRWLDETIEEILNLLDNPEDTSALRTMLEEHIENSNIHVTSTEKSKWNNHVDDTVAHMTATDKTDLANAKAHISNSNIHITTSEKSDIASAKTHITNNDIHVTTSEKTDIANAKTHIANNNIHVTSSEKTDISNAKTHIANNDIHVTATQKTSWNGAVSHVSDGTVHVTSAQKTNWDTHVSDGTIHVTQAQKTAWDAHIANGDFHFSVKDKEDFYNHLEANDRHVEWEDKARWNDHANDTSVHVSATDRANWNGLKNGIAVNSTIGASSAPSVYYASGARTHIVNASNSTIGISNVDEWCALETIVPYSSASSDKLTQIAYTKSGVYVRNSVGNDTATATWGAWDKLVTAQEVIDVFSLVANPTSTTHFTVGSRNTSVAIGTNSLTVGTNNRATANYSVAFGNNTYATGAQSFAIGSSSSASGSSSVAFGQVSASSGAGAFTAGGLTTATGDYSRALGYGVNAINYGQTVLGVYNTSGAGLYSATAFNVNADALIIGNGTVTSQSNALRLNNGGYMYIKGTYNTTGADYGEFFEWLDGNIDAEDRIGYVVALDGDKIKKASNSDEILGIISGTASVVGDSYQDDWNGRYVTDEWGRIQHEWIDIEREEYKESVDEEGNPIIDEEGNLIMETIKVPDREYRPIVNPNYDSEAEYIPREKRKEWSVVGLMGKIYVRHDGTLNVNNYAKIGNEDGVLTKSEEHTNIRVIERVSENVVRVFIK